MTALNNAIELHDTTIVRRFLDRGLKSPTELHLGELLADLHRDRLRWVRQCGHYYAWDGRRWRDDASGDLALAAAQDISRLLFQAAAAAPGDDERKRIAKWALEISSDRAQRAVLRQAAPALVADITDFDRDSFALNVHNGTIDLRTGELRRHNPDDLISKIAAVEYDPVATCPRFEQFLREVFIDENGDPDENLIAFIQRMMGYALTGDAREECIFILWGEGANGKSKLIEVFGESVLGEYACTCDVATFEQPRRDGNAPSPDVARLAGARLVATSEPTRGIRLNEGFLKSVTGRDKKPARFLHQNPFEFTPVFKLLLATNHKPEIRSTDYGTWRRIRLIPFLARFVEGVNCDTEVGTKLKAEAAGILAWAVRGCLAWQRERLEPPPTVTSATAVYQAEMSVVRRFVDEACILASHASIRGSALYAAYKRWSENTGERVPLTKRAMFEDLRKQFRGEISDGPVQGQVVFRGVGPRDDQGDEGDEGDEDSGIAPVCARKEKPRISSPWSPSSPNAPLSPDDPCPPPLQLITEPVDV